MTVRELDNRLTREELIGWMAYERIEPIGDERADYRAAWIAYTNAMMWADEKSKLKFEDYIIKFEEAKTPAEKRQTVERQKQIALMTAQLSGKIKG